jgi:hypothetical protein
MKHRVVLGFAAALGLLVAATFVVPSQTSVAPKAIETSVIRSSDLLEKAWSLPVASAFDKRVTWQSNGSRCGPASLANSFRSIGEDETTEADVLSGTGTCWTGYCINRAHFGRAG